jgi:hypothetical protein
MGWRRMLVVRCAVRTALCANVFASDHLFADDTPVPALDPGRGRTKTDRPWVYARDQRRWEPRQAAMAQWNRVAVRARRRPEELGELCDLTGS